MSTRFIGAETEYGITTPTASGLSPIVSSTHAVVAYAALHTKARSRWDFAAEHPLRDSRGFDVKRYSTVPVVNPNAIGVANVILPNGARYYVDHAHPEYSAPECNNAWDAMLYDAAGNVIVQRAAKELSRLGEQGASVLEGHEPCPPARFYKNNVDGKGASYGSHENYLYSRDTDFDAMAAALIPFFVTRQVVVGAGRVGIGPHGEEAGFQISQRADYFEQEVSLETTLNRGIINTRDEPHADGDRFGRLHVIIGDANQSQTSNLLKFGMTDLVLDAIEAGVDFTGLALDDPVEELRLVSRDLSLTHALTLADGRKLTALDILGEYRARVTPETDVDHKVLAAWDEAVELLGQDPLSAGHLLDWAAKYRLVRAYMDRGVDVADPKLAVIDLQYADTDPDKSLYYALIRKGQMRELVPAEDVEKAADTPPSHSRAYLRGRVLDSFGDDVVAASWDSIVLHTVVDGLEKQAILRFPDISTGTQDAVGAVVENAQDVGELLNGLARHGIVAEYR